MKKRTHVWLVVQEGGSSTELYANTFNTPKQAEAFRRSCDKAAYRTTQPIEIPIGAEEYLGTIQDVLSSLRALE